MGFTPNLQVTQPTPQTYPFTQNFSTLDATSTTYLTDFRGWKASILPTSSFVTTGTLVGDTPLTASSTAGTTSGNVHNYNGKIGFFELRITRFNNSSSFKTTGKRGDVCMSGHS
jgi:hypothetical protein